MVTTTNPLRNILGERPLPPKLTHAQEIALANRVSAAQKAQRRLHSRALTAQRKRALRRTIADAQVAREDLMLHNLPLVLSLAGRFRHSDLGPIADNTAADPEASMVTRSLAQVLEESLDRLDEREAQILRLRFGLGGGEARPLRAIAAEWRMSPEGVRQISERAMSHLRAMSDVRELSVYLE